jgi:protein-tyrosine phosphatase
MQYIDIHSHILYEIDDGADNLDVSVKMLEQAAMLGIEHVQATPHATEMMHASMAKQFIERFNQLEAVIKEKNIPVRISLAAEVFFSELIFSWMEKSWATFGGPIKYLLFELPMFEIPDRVEDFIFECRMKKIIPILAHPERYIRLQDRPELLLKWYEQGCFMQLNAGSIVGQFGEKIQEFAARLVRSGIYQFVASDAHEHENRNFHTLINAVEEISILTTAEHAREVSFTNPMKALQGEKVIPRENIVIPNKKRWYKQVFRKYFKVSA